LLTFSVYWSDCPALTGSGESVFEIDRSAEVLTVVACVALLFALEGSDVLVATVAVLEMFVVRFALTFTTRWRSVDAPDARSPRFQVTVPAVFVPPLSAETKLVPAGSGSVTVVLCAVEGPAFATWSV
jgi:hypothetical protein